MEKAVFDISKFNIIQDDKNYYVFRALNKGDHKDIEMAITSDEHGIIRVRTDRERFDEEKGEARYSAQSEISLEEVWNHIKIRYIKETNCISLSSNANVAIDYGQGYNEEYIMVKIPKQGKANVYNAGQYMLEEINRKIEEVIRSLPSDSKILERLQSIDEEKSNEGIKKALAEAYTGAISIKGEFSGKGNSLRTKKTIISRLDKKQYFSDEQQLEYNRIIAKLSVLETYGILRSILPTQLDNSSLIRTVSMAFSSGELIHYKDIEQEEFIEISKEMMDILSLIQQVKEKEGESEEILFLEKRVIGLINDGYKFIQESDTLFLSNGEEKIKIRELENKEQTESTEQLSIEEIYLLTQGRISYQKAKIAFEFAMKLSQSKLKAIEYAEVIRAISDGSSELARKIEQCYTIDEGIISREDFNGVKIAESVNIGLTREQTRFVSSREQLRIIQIINKFSKEELKQITEDGQNRLKKEILETILDYSEEISENRFFAEIIIDGLDFSKIYKNSLDRRIMTEEERKKLIEQIEKADCKRLYNAFKKAGVKDEYISGYVVNLLMDNGYKEYDFIELSRAEDLDEIIGRNILNLNQKIPAIRMNKQLEIQDNLYEVEGTKIRLRDYQYNALNKINEIHQEKRFASVILPTGAWKSFVAMSLMQQYKNGNILYFAPNITILKQIQRHIIKYILNRDDVPNGKEAEAIQEAFPHLKMFCYQGLTKKDEELLQSYDADLIIFDELHRTGAEKWDSKIKTLLDGNKKAKILGITATPVRDVDKRDMAREMAEMTGEYTQEELNHKKYLAAEMYLLDAMQDNIVVTPKVVAFDYTLEDSQEYQEVKRMCEEEKNPAKKLELQKIYDDMKSIIRHSKMQGMAEILKENIRKKDGRYIIFLPRNSTDKTSEEYIKDEIEKVKEYFKEIDPNPEVSYLLSDREQKKDNLEALRSFESSDSEHLKLIFAIDMLNEGVHVDDIDGIVMLRPIKAENKILYLQQIGRCIFAIDPENPIPDDKIPVIFDVYNNYLEQNMDREANKTTPTSDLQRLQIIVNWINAHGFIPDINSEFKDEYQKAMTLKSIKAKYGKYINGISNENLSEVEVYEIQAILELGKTVDLWDFEIPERINEKGKTEPKRNNAFRVKGEQKRFLDLFKKATKIKKDRKLGENLRIRNVMTILDLLSEYGIEINNNNIKPESTLKDILKNIEPDVKEILLGEIEFDEDYPIGQEYAYAKETFYKGKKIFLQYDIRDLRRCGIFESFILIRDSRIDWKRKPIEVSAVENGFIKEGPSEFKRMNIMTGTVLDEQGYRLDGTDKLFFEPGKDINKYGFRRDGIHTKTQTIYDEHNFRIDGTYLDTGKIYDLRGFRQDGTYRETGKRYVKAADGKMRDIEERDSDGRDIDGRDREGYDRRGRDIDGRDREGRDIDGYDKHKLDRNKFDKEGFFYELQEDGTYKNTGRKIDNHGFNKEGYYLKIQSDGTYRNTGRKLNDSGFAINGKWYESEEDIRYGKGEKLNPYNFDIDGFFYEVDKKTKKHNNTGRKLNDRDFDIKGYFWKKQKDGTYVNTGKKYDLNGFEIDKLSTRITTDGKRLRMKQNIFGFDFKGNYYTKIGANKYSEIPAGKHDTYGFDVNGIHYITGTKLNPNNFDRYGSYYELQPDGKYKNTRKKVNDYNFNLDGHYCELQSDGTYKDTGKFVDPEGYQINNLDKNNFSRRGFYLDEEGKIYSPRGFKQDGTYLETGLPYDENKFNIQGKHVITGTSRDIRGFDCDGKCYVWRKGELQEHCIGKYDQNGFKQDGTYLETGEKFHEGYNAFGVDENGKTREGKEHIYIEFTKRYLNAICGGENSSQDMRWTKQYVKTAKGLNTESEFIRLVIYAAGEMYPKIRETIITRIELVQTQIRENEQRLEELRKIEKGKKKAIQKLEKENEGLLKELKDIESVFDVR